MKILIDFCHPAHVHYFKNFIKIMQKRGHVFKFIARDKEITFQLLDSLKLNYISRGKGGKNIFNKILYIPFADYLIFKHAKIFKPDIFLSFSSPYAALVAKIIGVPHIAFDDTEHAKYDIMMYTPFTDAILTPICFMKDLGKKHIRFKGYMELCYLTDKYFLPDPSVLNELKLKNNQKYFILRFGSWNATHDAGQHGLTYEYKIKLINELNKLGKVFISSENELPKLFKEYTLPTKPEKMHSILKYASLYIGEGSTSASECAIIGTPAIYINSLTVGYCKEQEEKYGLIHHFKVENGLIEKAIQIINDESYKVCLLQRRTKMLEEMLDVTSLMVWFVEKYPVSFQKLKSEPNYLRSLIF